MTTVVGVRFKRTGKIYYFDPTSQVIEKDSCVIVETARGQEMGQVVVGPKQVEDTEVVQPLKRVVRSATEDDVKHAEENCVRAKQAYSVALEKIAKHNLPMKLVEAEYTFDDSKLIFYFTADGRVDFRELVKDLASVFRTRIELRQIGVRDEAKIIGGLGPCGRTLCCASFLGDFDPVSIKMAKEQNLSLNPTKISGICGRLMCCLRYEVECYKNGEHKKGGRCPKQQAKPQSPNVKDVSLSDDYLLEKLSASNQDDGETESLAALDGATTKDLQEKDQAKKDEQPQPKKRRKSRRKRSPRRKKTKTEEKN